MKLLASKRIVLAAAIAASIVIATQSLHAELIEKTKKVAGTTVHYKVVLPNGYDPGKAYPGIVALGGGPQTMNTVDGTLTRNFRADPMIANGGFAVNPPSQLESIICRAGTLVNRVFLPGPKGFDSTVQLARCCPSRSYRANVRRHSPRRDYPRNSCR